jgi:hypothetical protein
MQELPGNIEIVLKEQFKVIQVFCTNARLIQAPLQLCFFIIVLTLIEKITLRVLVRGDNNRF